MGRTFTGKSFRSERSVIKFSRESLLGGCEADIEGFDGTIKERIVPGVSGQEKLLRKDHQKCIFDIKKLMEFPFISCCHCKERAYSGRARGANGLTRHEKSTYREIYVLSTSFN